MINEENDRKECPEEKGNVSEQKKRFTCRVNDGCVIAEITVFIEKKVRAEVDCCLLDYGTGNRLGVAERVGFSCTAEPGDDISGAFWEIADASQAHSPEQALNSLYVYDALMKAYRNEGD